MEPFRRYFRAGFGENIGSQKCRAPDVRLTFLASACECLVPGDKDHCLPLTSTRTSCPAKHGSDFLITDSFKDSYIF